MREHCEHGAYRFEGQTIICNLCGDSQGDLVNLGDVSDSARIQVAFFKTWAPVEETAGNER